MANNKYTRQTTSTYPDPESSTGQGIEVTAWTDEAWNKHQEALKKYQADQEWRKANPFLSGLKDFGYNALDRTGRFINDEIFLNKNNIRVRNAQRHPEVMNAIQKGGNIAGAIVLAPFLAYTAAETAPIWIPALKTAGQALTPSTWIGGFFDAFGTQAPAWLLNSADLGASAYFAGQTGKEIDKNGLNWKTGINALLSLTPFTREGQAIRGVGSALRNPVSSFSSVVDDFRAARNVMSSPEANFAREFRRSINNTKFINVPIEHVSTKGITEGAGLNSYSSSDVGFHFSPAGSPTTYNIQQATNAPFVRTGTWTYTNNTKPVFVVDKGNWRFQFNPEIYRGVNPGTTVAENTIALNQKGPNFTYINNYEGKGAKSYMTTQPNFGIQLSKNIHNNSINWDAPGINTSEGIRMIDGTLTPNLSFRLDNYLGLPNKAFFGVIPKHEDLGTFFIQKYSQNGRNYWHAENSDGTIMAYKTPEMDDFKIFTNSNRDDEQLKTLDKIANEILDSRHNFIESLPDNRIKSIVKSTNINDENTNNISLLPKRENSRVDLLRASVQDDIENIYLSDKYIDRYMTSLGINPKNKDLRNQVKTILSRDIYNTYDAATPFIFKSKNSSLGGESSTKFKRAPFNPKNPFRLVKIPEDFRYGINSNTEADYLQNDWTSILFHEFGHNIWNDETPFSKYIRNHNLTQINNEYSPLMLTEEALKRENADFVRYLRQPTEFRQRIMEGVRYGIKKGNLTPEEIYNECTTTGFAALKPFFTKDYLVKMLGVMLGSIPVIMNNKDDQSS